MGTGVIQPSFTSGELAPSLYGRVDFARYYTGLKTCRNFIVRQYGGLTNRPGTKLVVETNSSGVVRLIPFQFSTSQTYVLEFGNLYMRVIRNGGQVVYPVGHISAGQVVEVVTPYVIADLPYLKFTQSADVMTITCQGYKQKQLSRTDHHLWTLADFANTMGPFLPINSDISTTVTTSDITGTITLTAAETLFTDDHIGRLMYLEQAPDALVKRWEVDKTIILNEIRRAGSNYYQCVVAGKTGTVRPSILEGMEHDGDPGVAWKYLHSGFGRVTITAVASATSATATVVTTLPHTLKGGSFVRNIADITPGDGVVGTVEVRVKVVAHGYVTGDSVTIAGLTEPSDANGVKTITVVDANWFSLNGIFDDTAWSPKEGTCTKVQTASPSYKWAFEAWGGTQLYPTATTYFQQRQIFGGSYGEPSAVWTSNGGGSYTSFETHIPLLDDDALTYKIVSNEVNEIRHFVDIHQLVALTSGGPFVVSGGQDEVLTPTTMSAKRQEGYGCSHVRPVVVGKQVLYIQDKGSQIRSLGYSFADDAFVGNDLTVLSNHLFYGHTIVDWMFQAIPFSCIWAVRDDGILLGFTYLPEHEVAAWHRHDTDGLVENVCVVSEGDEDAVYLTVNRTIGGVEKRFIERMETRQFTDIEDAFFVDCGLTYDGVPATTFSGLDHLEGETVSILADGHVAPPQVVTSGAITLSHSASVVHVGLPYDSDIETLEINASGGNILDVGLIVQDTVTVFCGPDADHLHEYKGRAVETYGEANQMKSGLMEVPIAAMWSKQGRVFIRNSDPLPVSILAVIPDITMGGK
jgi:hypothetical protein